MVASVDDVGSTIRHTNCEVLLSEERRGRCPACETYRRALHSMVSQQRERAARFVDRTAPNSHVNYRWLLSHEKDIRMKNLHMLQRQTKMSLERISAKIKNSIEKNGEVLDEDSHEDMATIMKEHTASVNARFPEDSFQKIFWDQQLKALSVKNLRSVRWHPLMIKWCLYLRHHSGTD